MMISFLLAGNDVQAEWGQGSEIENKEISQVVNKGLIWGRSRRDEKEVLDRDFLGGKIDRIW